MKREELKEELFKYLSESPSQEREKITRLAAGAMNATALPDSLWPKIQKEIFAALSVEHAGFGTKLKSFFSPPLMLALALSAVGILVGAFILLSQGAATREAPLVEISANTPKQKGDILIAKGVRIENIGAGSVARNSGATDKIVLQSGTWQVALQHKELVKPLQFIFPGGMLEPIGTAFTVAIDPTGTHVNLTEGKIRLFEKDAAGKNWQAREIGAPYSGTLKSAPVETEIQIAPVSKKKQAPSSKYANYIGKNITVELKNGDRLSGRLRAAENGMLAISGSSGNLRIRERDVVGISRN
ncbi:MAG: hypothetical protein JSR44_13300 [Spirochaetes bacterium]|nr:hypothetical protein [Spirochaetota bacterium]